MTLIVLGEAGEEFAESVQYYESKEVGLGARFRDEVVEAVFGPARLRRNRRFNHEFETHSLPALARRYRRGFSFCLAVPTARLADPAAAGRMVHEEMLPTKHTKHADKAESA
jgi:hypothetical protein